MLIMLFLVGLQFGSVAIIPMIMVSDCVDYFEYKTGKRTEGAAFSLLTFTIKICLALGAAIGLLFLQFAGYNSGVEFVDQSTKRIIYFAYVGMPGIFSLLAVFPILKYDLFGDKKEKISAALEKRRNGQTIK